MISPLDIDDSISVACNLIDLTLKIGELSSGGILSADKEDLSLIGDFLNNEIGRFEKEPLAPGPVDDGFNELHYRQQLLGPLKRLKSRVDAALSSEAEGNDSALRLLAEDYAAIRSEVLVRMRLFELNYPGLRAARPKRACPAAAGAEETLRRFQLMRKNC